MRYSFVPYTAKLLFILRTAPHPCLPCVKGGGSPLGRLGGIVRYYVAKIGALRRNRTAVTIPQSASLTAPFTQGSLGAERLFRR